MLKLARSRNSTASKFKGKIFDCGSKIGFLTANVAYALERDGLGDELRSELKSLLG